MQTLSAKTYPVPGYPYRYHTLTGTRVYRSTPVDTGNRTGTGKDYPVVRLLPPPVLLPRLLYGYRIQVLVLYPLSTPAREVKGNPSGSTMSACRHCRQTTVESNNASTETAAAIAQRLTLQACLRPLLFSVGDTHQRQGWSSVDQFVNSCSVEGFVCQGWGSGTSHHRR